MKLIYGIIIYIIGVFVAYGFLKGDHYNYRKRCGTKFSRFDQFMSLLLSIYSWASVKIGFSLLAPISMILFYLNVPVAQLEEQLPSKE